MATPPASGEFPKTGRIFAVPQTAMAGNAGTFLEHSPWGAEGLKHAGRSAVRVVIMAMAGPGRFSFSAMGTRVRMPVWGGSSGVDP